MCLLLLLTLPTDYPAKSIKHRERDTERVGGEGVVMGRHIWDVLNPSTRQTIL